AATACSAELHLRPERRREDDHTRKPVSARARPIVSDAPDAAARAQRHGRLRRVRRAFWGRWSAAQAWGGLAKRQSRAACRRRAGTGRGGAGREVGGPRPRARDARADPGPAGGTAPLSRLGRVSRGTVLPRMLAPLPTRPKPKECGAEGRCRTRAAY